MQIEITLRYLKSLGWEKGVIKSNFEDTKKKDLLIS